MISRAVFILSFFISTLCLHGQGADLVSLRQSLDTIQGTERVDLLNRLIEELRLTQAVKAKTYAEEAYQLSQELSYLKGLSTSAVYLGIFERDNQELGKAVRTINTGLEAARKINDYPAALGGLDVLRTIYQITNRKKRLSEVEEMYKRIKTRMDLRRTSEQLAELEKVVEFQEEELDSSLQENQEITAKLAQTIEEKLRQEAQLARSDRQKAVLEKEAAEQQLELQTARNTRNLALALTGILLALMLSGWQRYRLKKERKLAEIERQRVKRLEEIDRLKDQFLDNTSHELRTPLNGIIGLAEWLRAKGKEISLEVRNDNLSMMISAGKRLHKLVNDIMDFSRLRRDELQLFLKPLDIHVLADLVVRINQPIAKQKELNLTNTIPEDLPAVMADEDRLQQILHNLIDNALKFTETGSITLAAEETTDKIHLSITDTGIGIPLDKHDSIFQAFQQESSSTVREFSGAGLGLSIAKNLVELHGEKIWLDSKPGTGSTFYISLAKTDQAPETLTIQMAPILQSLQAVTWDGEKHANKGHKRIGPDRQIQILIVDDEPLNQQVLHNHLDAEHYSLTTAMNGNEALKALAGPIRFDLVILDVMMPRMSGYEVCTHIRKQYLPSELPIIMVTAKNQVKDLVTGLDTGANDYLAKPFSRDEFLARVRTLLNLHTLNQASGRFVPNAFLRTLGKENITQVQLGDQVEQRVTVFFTDIRSYTTLAEGMTPKENFRFVDSFNRRLGPTITKNHGFINQYLGDAIMAIFQHNATHALQAAIEFQHTLRKYNDTRLKRNRRPIACGIGFHTGELIMGIIGDEERMDAATISDTVNTAARMESLNKHYGTNILFSEDSFADLEPSNSFNIRYLGPVQMKGKKLPVGVYECFDGDHPVIKALKMDTLPLFQQGLQLFFNKNFKKAQQIFTNITETNPDDLSAQLFLQESLYYMQQGIPDDWTGVNKMEVK